MKKQCILLLVLLGLLLIPIQQVSAQPTNLFTDSTLLATINQVLFSRTDETQPISQTDIDTWDPSLLNEDYIIRDVDNLNQDFLYIDMQGVVNENELMYIAPLLAHFSFMDSTSIKSTVLLYDFDTPITDNTFDVAMELANAGALITIEEKKVLDNPTILVDENGYMTLPLSSLFSEKVNQSENFATVIWDYTTLDIDTDISQSSITSYRQNLPLVFNKIIAEITNADPEKPLDQFDFITGLALNKVKYIPGYENTTHTYFGLLSRNSENLIANTSLSYVGLYVTDPTYTKEVTINYMDENENPIQPATTQTMVIGNTYDIDIPYIAGYSPVSSTLSETITSTTTTINIPYIYHGITTGKITFHFEDNLGNALRTPVSITGVINSSPVFVFPQITKYNLPTYDMSNLVFSLVDQEIHLTYNLGKGRITLLFTDENENPIREQIVLEDFYDEVLNYTIPTINGYRTPTLNLGSYVYNTEAQEVRLIYTAIPTTKDIRIQYVDENNEAIAPETLETLEIGSDYSITAPVIAGYTPTLSVVQGTVLEDTEIITVSYTKDALTKGRITLVFEDKDGKKIREDIILEENIGTKLSYTLPNLVGFNLPTIDLSGYTFTLENQTITLSYSAIPTKEVDNKPTTETGKKTTKTTDQKATKITLPKTGIADGNLLYISIISLGLVLLKKKA